MSAVTPARVVLLGMGSQRAPGSVKAVISDPTNLGCSLYYNSPGEFHMTLPANHPQAGACEPWRTHYRVEEWKGGKYVPRFYGLLTDFDATDNDVVVYGVDYLGLLDRVIDARYVDENPDAPPPEGSKHVSAKITSIIRNLLNYARNKNNSPVKFIDMGPMAEFAEVITIYSTFVSIGPFVMGLIDSHRGGAGVSKRPRLKVEPYSGGFRFNLSGNSGRGNRSNIRFEYGGLVQGFQIIGYGGNFAAIAHGIGRSQKGSKLHYRKSGAAGIDPSFYGAIETVDFYDNIADRADLERRVRAAASTAARPGKRLAMGLRVDGRLSPLDEIVIGDHIAVDIQRGVVDTQNFGDGWWTVLGQEWRVFPDGHAELTYVTTPKEDGSAPDHNLLVDQEVLPDPVEIADGSVTAAKLAENSVLSLHIAPDQITTEELATDAVDSNALAPDAVTAVHIAEGSVGTSEVSELDASVITSGTIQVSPGDGTSDGTEVRDADGTLIGYWTTAGLVVIDPDNPDNQLRMSGGSIEYWDAETQEWLPAILPSGITADAITEGTVPGGHNRIPNAGFEMTDFGFVVTPGTPKIWTATADWSATIGTDVNVDKSTGDLKLLAFTY